MTKDTTPIQYLLTVRQQPVLSMAVIPGLRERRSLEPCPIIQLKVIGPDGTELNIMDGDEDYVLSVHLRDKDGQKTIELAETIVNVSGDQQSAHSNETAVRSALSGCLVSSSHRVKDLSDEQMTIFFFPDLKVWIAGRFSLYFKLFYMPKKDSPHLPPTECLAGVASDKFTVYTLKEFPGVYESTPLSKHLTAQGLCISIRNKSRLKVSDDDNGATMEADHLDKNHDP